MNRNILILIVLFFTGLPYCIGQTSNGIFSRKTANDSVARTIHVFVALCDNTYQGIMPVPKAIGNGQDPANNLYWGCAYGIKTFFRKSKDWQLITSYKIDSILLERCVFKHNQQNYYLVADAYNGKYIEQCIRDFLYSCGGKVKDTLIINGGTIGIAGNSPVVAYIGHNGLMDFKPAGSFKNTDGVTRNAIVLACASKPYFTNYLKSCNAYPLLWTTNLMAPEAYTLHDALSAYIKGEQNDAVRSQAAKAYAYYQKCSEKAARGLLVTGW